MIFAITGPIGSGKSTLAQYLKDTYKFQLLDLREEFYAKADPLLSREAKFRLFHSGIAG
ncbi:MAG: dephospho-CoA kinase [Candidatus Pacebacteria bacterium]|nr:dephospho-CoA kinase [Candidatus Paceibacterota bacterium]